MAAIRTYNPSVRVGNWNEDIQLEEDQLKNFLEKRERGELLIQKTHNLSATMGRKLPLSVSQDFAVHFGDHVMIQCGGAKDRTKYFQDKDPRNACILALNVSDPNCLLNKSLMGAAGVSGCMNISPNQRTVYRLEHPSGGFKGTKLTYGQPFYLVTVGENTGKLYLSSDKVSFNKCAKKSRHQEVSLVPEPSFLTQWRVEHRNPLLRMEYENEPVEANQELIFVHCKTNQCLAVEHDYNIRTPFGREYEISTHTFLDSHKAEEDRNHFMIVMGVPGSFVEPVPEQGPPDQDYSTCP